MHGHWILVTTLAVNVVTIAVTIPPSSIMRPLYQYIQILHPVVIPHNGTLVSHFRQSCLSRSRTLRPRRNDRGDRQVDFEDSLVVLADLMTPTELTRLVNNTNGFSFARTHPTLIVYFEAKLLIDEICTDVRISPDRRLFFFDHVSLVLSECYVVNMMFIRRELGKLIVDAEAPYFNLSTNEGFLKRRSDLQGLRLRILLEDQNPFVMFRSHQRPFEGICSTGDCSIVVDGRCKPLVGQECDFSANGTYYVIEDNAVHGLFWDVFNVLRAELNFTSEVKRRLDGVWGKQLVIRCMSFEHTNLQYYSTISCS